MPGTRIISMDEVSQHNSSESLWMVIHNAVYDVTKFLKEHPGGEDALMDFAGQEATEAFEEVGHSDSAREIMKKYKIGDIEGAKKQCKWCGHFKKYAPYGVAIVAGLIIIGIVGKKMCSK